MRRPALVMISLAAVAVGSILMLASWRVMDGQTKPAAPRTVRVPLLGAASKVEGVAVPGSVATGRITSFQFKEPSILAVVLPEGRVMTLPVKTAFININYGIVVDVDLLPLMHSVPYKEAVAALRRCLEVLGVAPDAQMRAMMAGWPDDAPGFDPIHRPGSYPHTYRAGMSLSKDVSIMVKMRAADDGGWFFVLTLESDGDARRAVWDPSFRPRASPPSGGPAGKE